MNQKLKQSAFAGLLCLNLFIVPISFATTITVGRYLTALAKPRLGQQNLLQQQVQLIFPQTIYTIRQAIVFMLQFTGYTLVNSSQMGDTSNAMLNHSLPEIDRRFGPMSLEKALHTLAGNEFFVLVDPVHRMIAFQLKPSFSHLYS